MVKVGKKAADTDGFVKGLNQACDDVPHIIPAYGDGRQITLAKRMSMSQEGSVHDVFESHGWKVCDGIPHLDPHSEFWRVGVNEDKLPWVALKDVHGIYGMTLESARNAIAAGNFPVATYKLGRMIVIDRVVHEEFFARHREAGLRALRGKGRGGEDQ